MLTPVLIHDLEIFDIGTASGAVFFQWIMIQVVIIGRGINGGGGGSKSLYVVVVVLLALRMIGCDGDPSQKNIL